MAYIGKKPTDKPLTSADLGTGIVTSAKILDGTIANVDVNDVAASKLTGALPAISGTSLTALNATNLGSGTIADARLPTATVAKGGTNLTSFVAGDLLYATGATTLAKLAKGTTVQTLKMNSGATAPEWVTVAAGGGAWTYLNTYSIVGGSSTIEIETAIDSTYRLYAFIWDIFNPTNDGHSLFMRVKSGGSYQTSGYGWNSRTSKTNTTSFSFGYSSSGTAIEVFSVGIGNAQTEKGSGIFYLPNPADTTTYKSIRWDFGFRDGSNILQQAIGVGSWAGGTAAITGLQFYMTSGNMNAGNIYIYGIKHS